MPTDSATAKFLYTILKQLDLKSIDWNKVSSELGITNGHAARMRYSRFKQQMEGTSGKPRRPRQTIKPRTPKPKQIKEDDEETSQFKIKAEDGIAMDEEHPGTPAMTNSNDSLMGSTPCTPVEGMRSVKPEPHGDDSITVVPASSQCMHSPDFAFDSPSMVVGVPEEAQSYVDLTSFAMDRPGEHQGSHRNIYQQSAMISGMHRHDMLGQSDRSIAMSNRNGHEFMQFSNPFEPLGHMDGHGQIGRHPQMGAHGVMMVKAEEHWDDAYCHPFEGDDKGN